MDGDNGAEGAVHRMLVAMRPWWPSAAMIEGSFGRPCYYRRRNRGKMPDAELSGPPGNLEDQRTNRPMMSMLVKLAD